MKTNIKSVTYYTPTTTTVKNYSSASVSFKSVLVRKYTGCILTRERQTDGHSGLEAVGREPDERQRQRRFDGQRCAGR